MEQNQVVQMQSQGKSRLRIFGENVLYIATAIALAMIIQQFIIRPFVVSGESMDPTLRSKDYLLIDEVTYRFSEPERGDVVVFRAPPEPTKFFIKRVIGLPGDTVSIKGSTITIINDEFPKGFTLKEEFITHKTTNEMTVKVPEDQYFVMGDNRAGSFDSRSWGTLPKANLRGRALLRLLPLSEIDYLPGKVSYEQNT
ncbi:MAG: signal peptidase [Patescibacteria group bacterium]|jgi:signal peptidase I|nr:signal peptidase [Patescibacteria group bacterium]